MVQAVMGEEKYDAGSANVITIGPDPRVRVLHQFTNVILRMPYVARDGIDPAVVQSFRDALLAQRSSAVLTNFFPKLKGFREVKDSEYNELRDEMKEASQFGDLKN